MKISRWIVITFVTVVLGGSQAGAEDNRALPGGAPVPKLALDAPIDEEPAIELDDVALSCPAGFPIDCNNGWCCDNAHPTCCPGGTCSNNGSCGGGGGTCPTGQVQCGNSHCVPSGTVCCAGAGHEELYCQSGQTCTSNGQCAGGGDGGGGCDPGFAPCGAHYCAPVGSVCCAAVGHEEMHCNAGETCTVSGQCDGGDGGGDGGGGFGNGGGCAASGADRGAGVSIVVLALLLGIVVTRRRRGVR